MYMYILLFKLTPSRSGGFEDVHQMVLLSCYHRNKYIAQSQA